MSLSTAVLLWVFVIIVYVAVTVYAVFFLIEMWKDNKPLFCSLLLGLIGFSIGMVYLIIELIKYILVY